MKHRNDAKSEKLSVELLRPPTHITDDENDWLGQQGFAGSLQDRRLQQYKADVVGGHVSDLAAAWLAFKGFFGHIADAWHDYWHS